MHSMEAEERSAKRPLRFDVGLTPPPLLKYAKKTARLVPCGILYIPSVRGSRRKKWSVYDQGGPDRKLM